MRALRMPLPKNTSCNPCCWQRCTVRSALAPCGPTSPTGCALSQKQKAYQETRQALGWLVVCTDRLHRPHDAISQFSRLCCALP